MPLILSPAEESLTRYYENLGLVNAFQGERKNVRVAVTSRRSR